MTHSFPTRRSSDLCAGLMTHMDGERRAAVAAIAALAERRRGETPELAFATFNVKMMQRDRSEHHASRARYLLTDPAMAPAGVIGFGIDPVTRSEEHTSELQSLMRISYADFCLKKKK